MSVSAARPVTIASLRPEDVEAVLQLDQWAFGYPEAGFDHAADVASMEWDRAFGVWSDGAPRQLVGTNLTHSFDLPVPGGSVRCAGLTWVGVHPGHRRRGILTAMMRHHLAAVRERGEPVAALFAAEPAIYGRFGYGLASFQLQFTLPRRAALRDVPGADEVEVRFEAVDPQRHADLIGDCYELARRHRPGMVSRNTPGLRQAPLVQHPFFYRDTESLRIMSVPGPAGEPLRGYALFRRKSSWVHGNPEGTVLVTELVSRDPAATRALWGRLVDLDLTSRVETDPRPCDDPLLSLLMDVRVTSPRMSDGLWVRLVDVPAALAARRYPVPLDVVLEVSDEYCPWNAGRWRLVAERDKARCEPTSAPADLSLDVAHLASAFLGGKSLSGLAAAGMVEVHRPGALHDAAPAFGWPVAPFCGWTF